MNNSGNGDLKERVKANQLNIDKQLGSVDKNLHFLKLNLIN